MINYFTPKYMEVYINKSGDKARIKWLNVKIYQLRAKIKSKRFNNRDVIEMDDLEIQICTNTLNRFIKERKDLYNGKVSF